jgi:AmmeMemoRadiSam system protein B
VTTSTRPAAVAGLFYPDDPEELRSMVDADLAAGARNDRTGNAHPPKAIVAPHAGYVYSGPVAGTAYARLGPRRGTVDRVLLLGPAHRVAVRGIAVPGVDAFAGPLGPTPIDADARQQALTCPGVHVDDVAHADEHSLEVHLPFLQRVLGTDGWRVLPLLVGRASPTEVATVLDLLWGGPETLIVVSSDLSHYHRQSVARRLDRRTAEAIVARDVERLDPTDACGAHPLAGLLLAARHHDLDVELLDLRTSADTAGEPSRVVGYGAFAVG